MNCHHCDSQMVETDCVQERGTRQTWFRCPLCAAEHTVVEPAPSLCQRLGDRLRWFTSSPTPADIYATGAADARHRSLYRKA